ncbi:hypothetical protein [Fibrisoma montanum]|nr:hypothetical protein [Fibrisoma montanum]
MIKIRRLLRSHVPEVARHQSLFPSYEIRGVVAQHQREFMGY